MSVQGSYLQHVSNKSIYQEWTPKRTGCCDRDEVGDKPDWERGASSLDVGLLWHLVTAMFILGSIRSAVAAWASAPVTKSSSISNSARTSCIMGFESQWPNSWRILVGILPEIGLTFHSSETRPNDCQHKWS
jgi:hypothetical protein